MKFLFPVPKEIPIIHFSDSSIQVLSYVSIIVFISLFFSGIYLIYKKKKHGIRVICLAFLLLINPIINLVLN